MGQTQNNERNKDQNQERTYRFVGELETRSEVAISAPSAMTYEDLKACQVHRYIANFPRGDDKLRDKIKWLPRLYAFTGYGTMVLTPYVPASSLRGMWRHRAAQDLLRRIKEQVPEANLRIDDYIKLALGGILQRKEENGTQETGKERQESAGVFRASDSLTKRENNPYLSVWGSLDENVSGKVAVEHLVYVDGNGEQPGVTTVTSGVRSDPFQRNPELIAYFEAEEVRTYAARFEEQKRQRDEYRRHQEEEKKRRRERAMAERGEANEPKANGETGAEKPAPPKPEISVLLPLPGYEMMPRGVRFNGHRITLYRATEVELGVLVRALRVWGEEPRVGGSRNHGCGRLAATYAVLAGDDEVGRIEIDGEGGVQVTGEALARAEAAWLAYPLERLLKSL